MAKVKALKAFPYNGRRIAVGDVVEMSDKNARILKAIRKVDDYVEPVAPKRRAKAEEPKVEPAVEAPIVEQVEAPPGVPAERMYLRRDMKAED